MVENKEPLWKLVASNAAAMNPGHGASLVREVLSGSWRASPAAQLELSTGQLHAISPLLHGSGAAGLAWWRVRETDLRESPAAVELQQAYRLQVLRNAVREQEIEQVFGLFRSAGIEPILIKGWATARNYANPALRPYGDIDLLVRPEQRGPAEAILETAERQQHCVDLDHYEFGGLTTQAMEELYKRSRLLGLGGTSVRVLGLEDHLRLLCLHLWKHGAWRPLWLCDVAATLESTSPGFSWECCLGEAGRQAEWVACAVGLAHRLLGARVNGTPAAVTARKLPGWLLPAVMKQWGKAFYSEHPTLIPFAKYLRHPGQWPDALRLRWPDPIQATVQLGAPFNGVPRVFFQLEYCLVRLARFLGQLPQALLKGGGKKNRRRASGSSR